MIHEIINDNPKIELYCGDCLEILKTMPDESIDCVITSPPYWGLRDYGIAGQFGLEKTPEEYVAKMVEVFRKIKRILKKEGTLWLNLGDTYIGGGRGFDSPKQRTNKGTEGIKNMRLPPQGLLKSKDLVGIPWRVAFALQADGWYLRSDIIWAKGCSFNYPGGTVMPESVTDRPTKAHEYVFLLTKNQNYFYDAEAIKETATGYDGRKDTKYKGGPKDMACGPHERWKKRKNDNTDYGGDGKGFQNHSGYNILNNPYVRNIRDVWVINLRPFKGAHFAVFPEDLVEPMIKGGCPKDGTVLDPFSGSGTVGVVAKKLNRNFIGIDLNPKYIEMSKKRINNTMASLF